MNFEEVRREIQSLLSLSLSGQEIENPKVDCKRQWYKLNEEEDKNKFLKDTSSIANTVGLDGFIIIGYDERAKKFYDATFSDCGLRDTSDINGIVTKNVDRFFEISNHDMVFEGHKLSILHIPPSFDKPHVITCYRIFKDKTQIKEEKHRTFVRKGTSSDYATKYDLEFMYYDRKNIVPEYNLITSINLDRLNLHYETSRGGVYNVYLSVNLTFENVGRRALSIVKLDLSTSYDPTDDNINVEFTTGIINPYIIHPNEIKNTDLNLRPENLSIEKCSTEFRASFNSRKRDLQTQFLIMRTSNNKTIKSELVKYI